MKDNESEKTNEISLAYDSNMASQPQLLANGIFSLHDKFSRIRTKTGDLLRDQNKRK